MAKIKKKKIAISKQIIIVGVILSIAQGIFLFFFQSEKASSAREVIDKAVRNVQNLDDRRRSQIKIQLAISNYMANHAGKLPETLDQLRPEYFDSIPVDPKTGQPFAYKIVGGKAQVGLLESELPTKAAAKPGEPEQINSENATLAQIEDMSSLEFTYSPTGKRDPFRPFDLAPKVDLSGKTQLERYDIGQLKLTAVLNDAGGDPQAIVENAVGKGFNVKKGSKIGLNNGEVVEIQKDKIMILETTVDFAGQKQTKTVEMRLRTKDQDRGKDNP